MASMLKISEAATLALHSMAFLAANEDKLITIKEFANTFHASEAHLSKVLQRLAKAGLVKSTRGPRGGFSLEKDSRSISLLDVYEIIDGEIEPANCLLGKPLYGASECILGGLLSKIDNQVREYMSEKKLSDLACWGKAHESSVN